MRSDAGDELSLWAVGGSADGDQGWREEEGDGGERCVWSGGRTIGGAGRGLVGRRSSGPVSWQPPGAPIQFRRHHEPEAACIVTLLAEYHTTGPRDGAPTPGRVAPSLHTSLLRIMCLVTMRCLYFDLQRARRGRRGGGDGKRGGSEGRILPRKS
ncbi:hypothetical protein E2C01_011925 [Portunus trituberculatus]|uniref:Uncharacterized protein n=1 Tax=Portunus trituberculatus TaxID=210409 RepID=A0A5B7DCC9_PORTR|nr:hypothetical protein [Portunus trituberculatus]